MLKTDCVTLIELFSLVGGDGDKLHLSFPAPEAYGRPNGCAQTVPEGQTGK